MTAALREHGNDCLPLVLVDGEVVSRGTYPDRSELARLAGLAAAAEAETPKEAASSLLTGPSVVTIVGGALKSSGKCC